MFENFNTQNAKDYKNEIMRGLAQNYQATVLQVILAEYYQKNGEEEKALAQLKTAVETRPDLPHTYVALGNYYSTHNQYPEAIENFQKALKLDSQLSAAYHNLGNVYLHQGQYNKAVKYYQEALYYNSRYALSYLGLGIIYGDHLNEPSKAVSALQNYLRLDPNSQQKEEIEQKIEQLKTHL